MQEETATYAPGAMAQVRATFPTLEMAQQAKLGEDRWAPQFGAMLSNFDGTSFFVNVVANNAARFEEWLRKQGLTDITVTYPES